MPEILLSVWFLECSETTDERDKGLCCNRYLCKIDRVNREVQRMREQRERSQLSGRVSSTALGSNRGHVIERVALASRAQCQSGQWYCFTAAEISGQVAAISALRTYE